MSPALYTPTQISAYLTRLAIPASSQKTSITSLDPDSALTYLALLQRHHLATIPFENLTLHYSPHHQITLHPDELYRKIIGDANGRGGYCMENNSLFGALLKSLGYEVYSAGGRVWTGETWTGWSHKINIVKIGPQKFHVDVGFGGPGPTTPMPLSSSPPSAPQPHISPATARLQWKNITGNTDSDQRLWVYEHKPTADADFTPVYCFTELEFLDNDYQIMNYFTSTSNKIFFTRMVMLDRKVMGEGGELVGSVSVNQDVLKKRINGAKELEIKFASEAERVGALEEYFGIKLTEAERDGIRGLPSEIK
ncbi:unnamed protein product [Periconia digitata]|uniref:Arylamine N-acetyltransferase n=1 Tax=Periconia digitata TaxID=1303443 RepID=A0A9W4XMK7_9PLEO|nr:unnamed protein product [Periconia digitata]